MDGARQLGFIGAGAGLVRLRHRHATLPERAVLAASEDRTAQLTAEIARVRTEREATSLEMVGCVTDDQPRRR